jgi:hypothetical protein
MLVPQTLILEMMSQSNFIIVSSKGKKNKKQSKTNKQKNTAKCPKFKCNTVSVNFSACQCSLVVVSSKEDRKKESRDSSVNGYL